MNHLLDEPTTGLDPRSRHTIWQIIRDLVAGGDTIFLTTQYLKEADQLADSIAVLEHGKLVAQGTFRASSKGYGLEVEHARACYPHDPPASFTGTGRALYDTPTSTPRPLSPPN